MSNLRVRQSSHTNDFYLRIIVSVIILLSLINCATGASTVSPTTSTASTTTNTASTTTNTASSATGSSQSTTSSSLASSLQNALQGPLSIFGIIGTAFGILGSFLFFGFGICACVRCCKKIRASSSGLQTPFSSNKDDASTSRNGYSSQQDSGTYGLPSYFDRNMFRPGSYGQTQNQYSTLPKGMAVAKNFESVYGPQYESVYGPQYM